MPSKKNVFMKSKTSQWRREISCLPAVAALFCTSHAFAAVPAVVADAQQTIGTGNFNPPQVAVAPNGTVYVSDTNNNRALKFIPNLPSQVNGSQVSTPGYALLRRRVSRSMLPGSLHRRYSWTGNHLADYRSNGNQQWEPGHHGQQIFRGGFFLTPLAMTVDSANTLFIGDAGVFGTGAHPPHRGRQQHAKERSHRPHRFYPIRVSQT